MLKPKFQISLVLLTFLFGSCQAQNDSLEHKPEENIRGLVLKPLGIIIGEEYSEELFVATKQGSDKMGLYGTEGKEILPIIYDEVYSSLVNPYYVVVVENRRKGLFDLKGNRICQSIYDGFLLSPSDSSIIGTYLRDPERWNIINNQGEQVFSEDFIKIQFLQKGLVMLQNEDYKCSLASIRGEL